MKDQILQIAEKENLFQGNNALSTAKNTALATSKSLNIPTTKDEEWKFTNLSSLLKNNYTLPTKSSISLNEVFVEGLKSNYVVIVNGEFSTELSSFATKHIVVKSLKQAITENSDLVAKYYSQYLNNEKEVFSAYNTAFANDGIFIHVPKGKIEEAELTVYIVNDSSQADTFSLTRNLIVAEAGSIAKVVTIPVTIGANKSFQNIVNEIYVGTEANLEFNILQNDSSSASQVNTTQVSIQNSSVFTGNTISLKGDIIRNNMNLVLDGEHIEGNMNALYLLDDKTHVDNHTIADHKYPNCVSNELYKGIVDGSSRGVFNGKIYVREGAQKTNAFQQNNNVVLSDNATINTKPQLEIWADDVSCSHGATIGQLDPEALFFLRSRGINPQRAKAMLTQAFANEVTEKLTIEALKNHVLELIENRLG